MVKKTKTATIRRAMALCSLLFCAVITAHGATIAADTVAAANTQPHRSTLSYELTYLPGKTLAMDDYVKTFIKKQTTHSIAFEVKYRPTEPPTDGSREDTYDGHYNYPIISGGLRYHFNHGTTMHRDASQDWGNLQPVDYTTHLGDAITLYGKFTRPFFRHRRWECSYYLATGVAYAWNKYNRRDAIDNELVGAHMSIYFAGGIDASYRIDRQWSLHGGLDFAHHSNGALHRPNKGANYFGPMLGLVYTPQDEASAQQKQQAADAAANNSTVIPFQKYWFAEVTLGVGGKSLLEEWDYTQGELPPTDPDYRTEHFHIYPAYSMQVALMNRYKPCYATGFALDLFYGSYSDEVEKIDERYGHHVTHSPWSMAMAVKQHFYYKQFSLRGSLGYYLYRRMGTGADKIEKPYYERIGLYYSLPKFHHVTVGVDVKAHLGKADFTELQLAVPFKL